MSKTTSKTTLSGIAKFVAGHMASAIYAVYVPAPARVLVTFARNITRPAPLRCTCNPGIRACDEARRDL